MRRPFPTLFPPPLPLPPTWTWAPSVTQPGPACDESCQRRHQQAFDVAGAPHPDPEVRRWRAAEAILTRLVYGWLERSPPDTESIERWFDGRRLELRYPGEPLVFMEWTVLGFRLAPGVPTVAERMLPNVKFLNTDVERLARALVAAPVTLLRVLEADPASGMTLEPLCPPGPVVRVPDRASACLAHVGSLVGGRLLPAGAWRLLRPAGPMVAPSGARPLLAALDRALGCVGAARDRSLEALRDRPEVLSDLLATYAT